MFDAESDCRRTAVSRVRRRRAGRHRRVPLEPLARNAILKAAEGEVLVPNVRRAKEYEEQAAVGSRRR
jgi:hypothetical protein